MSAETSVPSRYSAVAALASLPLFQLSTAGMELFHTNMLYWLATERPDESIKVWQALGLPDGLQPPRVVRREWLKIDLTAWSDNDGKALVLENKIGAIPHPGQLNGYYAKLRSIQLPFSLDVSAFVLLTLTPPSFAVPEPWRSVTYRELISAFRETAQRLSGDESALVEAYAHLVTRLDEVATTFDPARDLDAAYALSPEERSLLTDSRLLVLVERVRAGRFAELATNRLRTELGEVGQVDPDFSNGYGMNHWFAVGPAGRRIGWQIQGGAFRLAVITGGNDPRPRAKREALVAELYRPYFDFSVPGHLSHTLGVHKGKKEWYGFEPNFVCRHAPLSPGVTWNELLDLVRWFSRRALEYVSVR